MQSRSTQVLILLTVLLIGSILINAKLFLLQSSSNSPGNSSTATAVSPTPVPVVYPTPDPSDPEFPKLSEIKIEDHEPVNFTGTWQYHKPGKSAAEKWTDFSELSDTFTLQLQQTGNQIVGHYASVRQGGNRIAGGVDLEDVTIKGVVKGNVALLYFENNTGESNKRAHIMDSATLTYRDETAKWQVLQYHNSMSDIYIPRSVPLKRIEKQPVETAW